MLAVWAEVLGFKGSFRTIIGLKKRQADLTEQLRSFFAVVVIQVLVWGFTRRTLLSLRNGFPVLDFDGFKRMTVFGLISFEQCSVI
jgi:hypothetical protein